MVLSSNEKQELSSNKKKALWSKTKKISSEKSVFVKSEILSMKDFRLKALNLSYNLAYTLLIGTLRFTFEILLF